MNAGFIGGIAAVAAAIILLGSGFVDTLGSAGDRLIGIAPDGAIVWQIHAPDGGHNIRKFHKAIRIAPDGKTAYGG